MTESEKKFFGKLAIIWAILTFLAAVFFACIVPESAIIPIILGIVSYLAVFVIIRVFDWLMDN